MVYLTFTVDKSDVAARMRALNSDVERIVSSIKESEIILLLITFGG